MAIDIPAVSKSGLYQIPLTLFRNGGKESIHFSVNFTAGDQFVFPLLTIVLGVVIATLTRWWAQKGKPQAAADIKGQLLLSRVKTRRIELPESESADISALDYLRREIHDILATANITDAPKLDQNLEEQRKKLEEFEGQRKEKYAEIDRETASIRRELIGEENRGLPLTRDEKESFHALYKKVGEVVGLREKNELTKADHELAQIKSDLSSLQRTRGRALIQRALKVVNTAEISQEVRDEISQICRDTRTLMSSAEDDNAFVGKLSELEGILTEHQLIEIAATAAGKEPAATPEREPSGPQIDQWILDDILKKRIDRYKTWENFTFLATIAAAALTGMTILYIGKNFGGIGDYITAFLWGLGADNVARLGIESASGATPAT